MKNLGRKIFIIFSFIATTIYASITAQVTPKVVYSGEVATYIVTIVGDKVKKPIITDICGTNVIGTSAQTSIQMVNMDYQKSYILSYRFMPRKSCVIPAVSVVVDDKTEVSNKVKVRVTKAVQDKNADFLLSLKPSKKELYVGEPFTLTLVLKQKQGAQAVDSKFVAPDFKGFWIKGEPKTTRSEDVNNITTTAIYKLAPQREGNLTIDPAQIKIATRAQSRDSWGTFLPQVKWRTYYSNELHIQAKQLPHNAKLVGTFTIQAKVDKTQINPSEPINVTVEVNGEGNLEDISSFKPYIQGVNVFAEKVEVKGNKLTQKLAFVSDKDFIIPAFSIAFYNLDSKRVEKISTKPIHIKVNGSQNTKAMKLNIKRDVPTDNTKVSADMQTQQSSSSLSILWLLITFIVGTAFGIVLVLLKPLERLKKEKAFNIKDEKLLLIKLLPFKDKDVEVKKIVEILEGNIYSGSKQNIDKKLLKEILKKYDIS